MPDYEKLLEQLYRKAINRTTCSHKLSANVLSHITTLAQNSMEQKGVYTVFVTLCTYKILHPDQDVRYHQTQLKNGFSGRTIDTQYITPTLKKLNLPAMAESGWLTRSLEQSSPYTLEYKGKIRNKNVKAAFLSLLTP